MSRCSSRFLHRLIFLFFFCSGFTSLVFEVIWERSLMKVFGTSSLAISTLLTAFMAGLALGAWIGGKFAHRVKRPLRAYGLLEGAIGAYALAIPWLLEASTFAYRWMFSELVETPALFAAARFLAAFVVLLLPTTLMGASLPLVSQWTARAGGFFETRVGLLYGMNTLGAFSGTVLAGFVLLPTFGLSLTNSSFAMANFILCAVVLLCEPRMNPGKEEPRDIVDDVSGSVQLIPLTPRAAYWLKVAFLGTGLVSMAYQVLWTRAYVIVLGSSTYSFTLILATFLAAIATGSTLISPFLRRISRPAAWLAATQFLFAAFSGFTFMFLDQLPELLFWRYRGTIGAPAEIFLFQFGVVAVLVFIPVMLQAMAFPLAIRALSNVSSNAGKDVGTIYAFNTTGAIIGSFASGFLLLPWLGLRGALTTVMVLNILQAGVLLSVSMTQGRAHKGHPIGGIAALAAVAIIVFAPGLDQAKLTRGMFRTYWARELFDPDKLQRDSPEIVFFADGVSATISVEKRGSLITLKANGKPEASDGADMATQILVALAPFLIRSLDQNLGVGGEDVAMVGYGSGVTAGAALQWPLRKMEVIEIEPAMIEASRFFDHVNHRPLEDPRMHIVETDGRNFLEFTPNDYDIIVSEPSNPWIAGVASLFTVEHFQRAKKKLRPGGVFAQWVQLYEIRPENVQRIIATFLEVFPHAHGFSSMPKGTDLILIGSEHPIEFDPLAFQNAWDVPSIRAELERAGLVDTKDFLGLLFLNEGELRDFITLDNGVVELNTDDNGLLEFQAPFDLIRYDIGDRYFQERYFSTEIYGDPRPYLIGWPDDWGTEEISRMATAAWRAGKPTLAWQIEEQGTPYPLTKLPEKPYTQNERVAMVRHAAALDLNEAVVQAWPVPGSSFHVTAADSAKNGKHLQAMIYLESEGAPPRGGFDGEKGLLYAYVLAERRYYRHAMEQLDGLRNKDKEVSDSIVFHLLDGFVSLKRRRYQGAFDAYLRAAELLGSTQEPEDAQ